MTRGALARLARPILVCVFAVPIAATAAGPVSGLITSKAGPSNSRIWTITLSNSGAVAANTAQLSSLTLVQQAGSACTPVVTSSFPIAVGNIAAAGSGSAGISIDFTGCAAAARFKVTIPFTANAGATTGSIVRYNQFR